MVHAFSCCSCIFLLFMMKAVVNEDSSRDVVALQHEIRLLKVVFNFINILIYRILHVKYYAFVIVTGNSCNRRSSQPSNVRTSLGLCHLVQQLLETQHIYKEMLPQKNFLRISRRLMISVL